MCQGGEKLGTIKRLLVILVAEKHRVIVMLSDRAHQRVKWKAMDPNAESTSDVQQSWI